MKYIKTYEYNTLRDMEIKKYLVIKTIDDNKDVILLVLRCSSYYYNSIIQTNAVYSYYVKDKNLVKHQFLTEYNLPKSGPTKMILYQSDDLQEVLDNLPYLIDTKKFNI